MTTIEYTRCMLVIAHDGYTRRTHSRTDRRRAQRIQYTHMNIHKFEFSSPFYSSSAVIFPIVWPRWLHFPMHCMQSTVERRQKSVREIVCTVYTSMFHSFALRIVLVVRVYLLCVFARPTISMRAVNVSVCVCESMWTDRMYRCAWINIIYRIMVDSSFSLIPFSLCARRVRTPPMPPPPPPQCRWNQVPTYLVFSYT